MKNWQSSSGKGNMHSLYAFLHLCIIRYHSWLRILSKGEMEWSEWLRTALKLYTYNYKLYVIFLAILDFWQINKIREKIKSLPESIVLLNIWHELVLLGPLTNYYLAAHSSIKDDRQYKIYFLLKLSNSPNLNRRCLSILIQHSL